MRTPTPLAVSSYDQPPAASKKPKKKRGLLFALAGCGCLALSGIIALIIIFIALGALSDAASTTRTSKNATPSGGTHLRAPTKKRAAKAKKVAEKTLAALESGDTTAAWKLTSPGLRAALGDSSKLKNVGDVLTKLRKHKKNYLVKQEQSTVATDAGVESGVQKLTYEYRSGHERRALECTILVQDSKVLGDKNGAPKSEDFQIAGINCSPITVAFRKSWGDKATAETRKLGDSIRELKKDGWEQYSIPLDFDKGTELEVKAWFDALKRGHYKNARNRYTPEMKKHNTEKVLRDLKTALDNTQLKKLKIVGTKWERAPQFENWLSGSEYFGTATVEASVPMKKKGTLTFIFELHGTYEKNAPAKKAANKMKISALSVVIEQPE